MKDAWELLQGMTPLIVASNPRALADRVLTSAAVMLDATCTAIFQREQDQMVLFASRGIRQSGMELVNFAWKERRATLISGQPILATSLNRETAPESIRAVLAENDAFTLQPIVQNDRVVGLLYIEGPRPLAGSRQAVVIQLASIAAVALRAPVDPATVAAMPAMGVDAYLERTPPDEVAREQLLVLLDRHEWNLSRVARALSVSRRTMYLRLEKYGIERRHVPKVVRRREAV